MKKFVSFEILLICLITNAYATLFDEVYSVVNYYVPGLSWITKNKDQMYNLPEVRDSVSIQVEVFQIRLKAAKQFVEERTKFLEEMESKGIKINRIFMGMVRDDLEEAKKDLILLEKVIKYPSKYKTIVIGQDELETEKKPDSSSH